MSHFCASCSTEGLAKLLVAKLVGAVDGPSTDRSYVLQTLPRGILRGLADTLSGRDLAGVLRAGAIVAGLLLTMGGYGIGWMAQRWQHMRQRIDAINLRGANPA